MRNFSLGISCWLVLLCCAAAPTTQSRTVRVAALGMINDLDFWATISGRFEKTTGIQVELVAKGDKDHIAEQFEKGGVDLLAMPAGDAIDRLVGENLAMDPQPWLNADLIIVGPANDPGKIKGMTDAGEAIKHIIESKSPFLIHASNGADAVVRAIVESAKIELDPSATMILLNDHQRQVLKIASDKHAYTLIARVPFKSGKLDAAGLVAMVEGDAKLRRPVVVAIANPQRISGARSHDARILASFLRSDSTQSFIAQFGVGKIDSRSLFSPMTLANPTTQPANVVLSVVGRVPHSLFLDEDLWKKLLRHSVKTKSHDGKDVTFEGVLARDVLNAAGLTLGDRAMNRAELTLYVRFDAADAYSVLFALPEFDDSFAEHQILIADTRDGKPMDEKEGPLRLIVPGEAKQARWIRQLRSISVLESN